MGRAGLRARALRAWHRLLTDSNANANAPLAAAWCRRPPAARQPAGFEARHPRACIGHAGAERCWWAHVPDRARENFEARGERAALVVDMHGGGGCAAHQVRRRGWA